jgi:hydroxymethylpyrimidine/phosphomethylpyrimidine kinase
VWVDGDEVHELRAPRVGTRNTHGTGCTLSSAVAALVPQRDSWLAAVQDAKAYLTGALACADDLSVGHGPGPVHHFWQLWD